MRLRHGNGVKETKVMTAMNKPTRWCLRNVWQNHRHNQFMLNLTRQKPYSHSLGGADFRTRIAGASNNFFSLVMRHSSCMMRTFTALIYDLTFPVSWMTASNFWGFCFSRWCRTGCAQTFWSPVGDVVLRYKTQIISQYICLYKKTF